jgi:hypothetical protein
MVILLNVVKVTDRTGAILEEQKSTYVEFQKRMADYGVAELAIDTIGLPCPNVQHESVGDDKRAVNAMKLLVSLLEGGNVAVQKSLFNYLNTNPPKAERFFKKISQRLQRFRATIEIDQRNHDLKSKATEYSSRKPVARPSRWLHAETKAEHRRISVDLVTRILHLLCEGHNLEFQELLRDQSSIQGLVQNTNLIEMSVRCLQQLLKDERVIVELNEDNCEDACLFFDLLNEVMQGPCHMNQLFIAKSAVIDISISLITAPKFEYLSQNLKNDLTDSAALVLYTLIEGRIDSEVHNLIAEKFDCSLFVERIGSIYHHEEIRKMKELGPQTILEQVRFGMENLKATILKTSVIEARDEPSSGNLEEAWALFRLMKGLTEKTKCARSEYCALLASQLPKVEARAEEHIRTAFRRFHGTMRSIEVSWTGLMQDEDQASLVQIWFPLPDGAEFMPETRIGSIKQNFPWGEEDKMLQFALVNNKNPKLLDLCYWKFIQNEMEWLEYLESHSFYKAVASQQENLKVMSFGISWILNFFLILTLEYNNDESDGRPTFNPNRAEDVVSALGIAQILCTMGILGFLITNKAPLVYLRLKNVAEIDAVKKNSTSKLHSETLLQYSMKYGETLLQNFSLLIAYTQYVVVLCIMWYIVFDNVPISIQVLSIVTLGTAVLVGLRQQLDNSLNVLYLTYTATYDCITTFEIFFYTVYTVISLLGQLDDYWWFSLLLLDLVMRAPALQNVAYAVYKPRDSILLTFLLTFIIVYIFTILAFYFLFEDFFNSDTGLNECQTMLRCFGTFMRNGLMFGGGMGDYMASELGHVPDFATETTFIGRAVFDLLFFIIIVVLLLNIVFGIIIDTFAALRETEQEQREQMTQKCAVCNITKDEIEVIFAKKNLRDGFETHIKKEHNMWNYVFYMIYVNSLDVTDLSGAEQYVLNQLGTSPDLGWMPLRAALCQNEDYL